MDDERLYEYYRRQDVLPTFGAFESEADLDRHERERRRLFLDRLALPPRSFAGARLLELGPDAGENALVFARWGAECTLAEPNEAAHRVIRDYFARFGLAARLRALEAWDVESVPLPAAGDRYDVVDAEGFVHTVQPVSRWSVRLAELLRPDGFAVLFYYEAYGAFLELVWRVVHARYRALTGAAADEAARAVFAAKWASIPHKRSLESWTMDVLESPFVRLASSLDACALLREMYGAGFRLYSSWPQYRDALDVRWFKSEVAPADELAGHEEFVRRSRLSHVFGRTLFLARREPDVDTRLRGLVAGLDALVDGVDDAAADLLARDLAAVGELVASDAVVATQDARAGALRVVAMLRELLDLLRRESADDLAAFCSTDAAFISSWGSPSHFAVFRRARD